MSQTRCRKTGSTFVIIMLVVCFVLIPLVVVLARIDVCFVDRARVQNVVEAAGLLAANDVSRIMINDPNFGFVSFSNYAPIGRATVAGDGEPLPVSGINMLIGTLRQNTILAHELSNRTMLSLASEDHALLERTIEDLNFAVKDALTATPREKHFDSNGEAIEPMRAINAFLNSNLPHNVKLVSVNVRNGWLLSGGRTGIAIPQPQVLAQLKPGQFQDGKYKPFINLPVDDLSFFICRTRIILHHCASRYVYASGRKTHKFNRQVRMRCRTSEPAIIALWH